MNAGVKRVTVRMTYGQCQDLHEWLDAFHSGWIYCGSGRYLPIEEQLSMTFEEMQFLFKQQREEWALIYPDQPVTTHFFIPRLDEKALIIMKLCWNVVSVCDA